MRWLVIALIRLYQCTLSGWFGPCCRFEPSCSEYCVQAVARYGCLRGLWMGMLRIVRCNPWHPGGFDPVPDLNRKERERTSSAA